VRVGSATPRHTTDREQGGVTEEFFDYVPKRTKKAEE
jgi:hypothetical protein